MTTGKVEEEKPPENKPLIKDYGHTKGASDIAWDIVC